MLCPSGEVRIGGGGGAQNPGRATGRAAALAERGPQKQTPACTKVIPWVNSQEHLGEGQQQNGVEQAQREHPMSRRFPRGGWLSDKEPGTGCTGFE